jgi:hypothetical protein
MCYVYDIDADTIWCLFACADVAPRGHEVELQRALERPPRGERRRCEDVTVRPAELERAVRRHQFDDPGAGPSHAPPVVAGANFENISRHLEMVLQEVPEGIWSRIQDEAFLEQCVGVSPPWRAIV